MVEKLPNVGEAVQSVNMPIYIRAGAIVVYFGEKGKNWRDIAKIISHLTGEGVTVKTPQ